MFSLSSLKNSFIAQLLLFILSLGIVAFSQAGWYEWMAPVASAVGVGLFAAVLLAIKEKFTRFYCATFWFFLVQSVGMVWLANGEVQGKYIYALYFLLSLLMGLQMGAWGLFVTPKTISKFSGILFLSGFWVLLEWIRLFFFTGFMWGQLGLLMTFNDYSAQLASVFGVFGLSFVLMLTNLLLLQSLFVKGKLIERISLFLLVALLPYAFGYIRTQTVDAQEKEAPVNVLLVQTALSIEEKRGLGGGKRYIHPQDQWRHSLNLLKDYQEDQVDLIIFPEYFVPFEAHLALYPFADMSNLFEATFGDGIVHKFPPVSAFSFYTLPSLQAQSKIGLFVSNAFCAQALSNIFNAEIVMGLDDTEVPTLPSDKKKYFSSAFHFQPKKLVSNRYDKRILLPLAEYIPFEWLKPITASYDIHDSFTPGKREGLIFQGKHKIAPLICYEELFGDLVRAYKAKGADMLVSLNNDAWYPNGQLPRVHYLHAKPRAIECGLPLLRSCNTGVTAIVDAYGRESALFGEIPGDSEWQAGVLQASVPMQKVDTLYSQFGDYPVLGISLLLCLGGLFFRKP